MVMSKKTAENYLKEPYARILVPEEAGGFSAELLEFPGCFAQGETADEAYRNIERAAKSWIDTCLEQGLEIPPASANQGYGGKIALRLPRSLHRQAVRMAERDKTSLNQFIVTAVAAKVGTTDMFDHLLQRLESRITIYVGNIQFVPLYGSSTWNVPEPVTKGTPLGISRASIPGNEPIKYFLA
jgi:predicted RNase H-like HicB family nuclease